MFDCGKLIQIAPIRVTLSTFFLFVALSVTSVETVSFKLKTVSEKTRNACKTLMSPSLLRPLRRKKNGGGGMNFSIVPKIILDLDVLTIIGLPNFISLCAASGKKTNWNYWTDRPKDGSKKTCHPFSEGGWGVKRNDHFQNVYTVFSLFLKPKIEMRTYRYLLVRQQF